MQPFVTHRGRAALLDWTDVNTDLIIPARYLKRIERTGYGPLLFADKRYAAGAAPQPDAPTDHGDEDPAFPLNRPEARGATILVVNRNFGCGSSREHAVWAVQQGGYQAVIAPGIGSGFADIFEGNAYQCGLLPIELPEADWQRLARAIQADGGAEVEIDLQAQRITVEPEGGEAFALGFSIPEAQRQRLLQGLDAIAETLLDETAIASYEARMAGWITPESRA